MKKLFIIANWKSNKTTEEVEEWFSIFNNSQLTINKDEKEVIVCGPFTVLPKLKELIVKGQLSIVAGAEDVSPFEEGAFTGEVTAAEVKEFVDYAIIGHSERRKLFNEDDELLIKKVKMALQNGLTPIFCVQDESTFIPEGVTLVAYEPVFAIGSGTPDTPENAEKVIKTIKEKNKGVEFVLYGGSVTPDNIRGFTESPSIDGSLVGGASLDAEKFIKLIENA